MLAASDSALSVATASAKTRNLFAFMLRSFSSEVAALCLNADCKLLLTKMRKAGRRSTRERDSKVVSAKPLARSFFNRDPRQVARALLGKLLVRGSGSRVRAGRIVEVEAYLGAADAAAHAASGETARNAVLFGPPGHAYVYLNYGLHYCLNVSCMPAGQAGCVLFRALEPLAGISKMARGRGFEISPAESRDMPVLKRLAS